MGTIVLHPQDCLPKNHICHVCRSPNPELLDNSSPLFISCNKGQRDGNRSFPLHADCKRHLSKNSVHAFTKSSEKKKHKSVSKSSNESEMKDVKSGQRSGGSHKHQKSAEQNSPAGLARKARLKLKLPDGELLAKKSVRRLIKDEADKKQPGIVSILQRPKDKKAAEELIASFFKKLESPSLSSSSSVVDDKHSEHGEVDCDESNKGATWSDSCDEETGVANWLVIDEANVTCLANYDKAGIGSCSANDESPRVKVDSGPNEAQGFLQGADIVQVASLCSGYEGKTRNVTSSATCFSAAAGQYKCLPLIDDEKWAGPAYINSPPPSLLPLPSFCMKSQKTGSLDSAANHVEGLSDIPSPVPSIRQSRPSETSDALLATMGLRRLLNLDLLSV